MDYMVITSQGKDSNTVNALVNSVPTTHSEILGADILVKECKNSFLFPICLLAADAMLPSSSNALDVKCFWSYLGRAYLQKKINQILNFEHMF